MKKISILMAMAMSVMTAHSHKAVATHRSRWRPLHRERAMSRIAIEWRSLRTQIREHRAQLGLSFRVTIAAVLSLVLTHLLNVPLPLWTVLTAVILTQVSFGKSLKATMDYSVGTLAGAVYAGAVAALVPHASEIALTGVLAWISTGMNFTNTVSAQASD